MSKRDDEWVRVADIRLPRLWPLSLIGGLLLARWVDSRRLADTTKPWAEIGDAVGQRWKEGDERDRQLLDLTRQLARLTRVLVVLTVVIVGVTVWAALHG